MGYSDDLRAYLGQVLEGDFESTYALLGKHIGTTGQQVKRWVTGENSKSLDMLGEAMDRLGVSFVRPQEVAPPKSAPQVRDIEFINPKIVGIENGALPPVGDDYLAVPLAEEAIAAGPGLIPSDALRGWVVVWRHHSSIRYLTDLVAVEIGKGQTSMVPHLHPGDIVLVNKADRTPDVDGKIMLVCDPDGGCAVKRVSSSRVDGDTELVFYSDNAAVNPPRVYRLKRDYGGDLHSAIGGRVVWAWSDMTRK